VTSSSPVSGPEGQFLGEGDGNWQEASLVRFEMNVLLWPRRSRWLRQRPVTRNVDANQGSLPPVGSARPHAAQKAEILKLETSLIQEEGRPPDTLILSALEDQIDSLLRSHGWMTCGNWLQIWRTNAPNRRCWRRYSTLLTRIPFVLPWSGSPRHCTKLRTACRASRIWFVPSKEYT